MKKGSNALLAEAVAVTGMVTMAELASRADLHRMTVEKHIAEGKLAAERRTIRGRPIWLIAPQEAARYAEIAASLLRNPSDSVGDDLKATGLVSAKQLRDLAGISDPTLRKHLASGLVKGKRRRMGGRLILVFEQREAERYAREARDIVAERTRENTERGPMPAPPGFVRLDELARRANRSVFDLYDRVKNGELPIGIEGTKAILIREAVADAFVARAGLAEPPGGMVSIPEAVRKTGIDPSTIHHAIRYGYVAAIPAKNVSTKSSGRLGRPKTLVSMSDVERYAAGTRQSRKQELELAGAIRLGSALGDRMNSDE